jgi:hypothetical protein
MKKVKSRGVVVIARNNRQLDYVKQAFHLAKRVKKYLNLPTTIITDSADYLKEAYDYKVFDQIVTIPYEQSKNSRNFYDGTMSQKKAEFKNETRSSVFDLSPYDETLLVDSDVVISNDKFLNCFESKDDFLIYRSSYDLSQIRKYNEFEFISDSTIDFYWATVVFYRKTETNRIFFDLVKHIQDNWNHYRRVYAISSPLFRNDFAFSIAIHIMNGYQKGDFASPMPGKLFYTFDRDILWDLDEDKFTFLVEKKNYLGEYHAIKIQGQNVHVMNKFSLDRCITKDLENE